MLQYQNYFDYGAATPILSEVVQVMQPYFQRKFYNPSAIYLVAQENKKDLEKYRGIIARGLGAKPAEVVFTAGGTEANNLAIKGVMDSFNYPHVVTWAIEHESVLNPVKNYDHSIVEVDKSGRYQVENLTKHVKDNTVLISCTYANNEIGTIEYPGDIKVVINEILQARQQRGISTPLYLHCDACQATNYLDLQVAKLGVDLMTINAGKIYGPKQCGALYIKAGAKIKPLILGGGQEKGLRSGTENLANIAGFAKAFEMVRDDYKSESKRLAKLRDNFIKQLKDHVPAVSINGSFSSPHLPNIINISIKEVDNEALVMKLDEAGLVVATGSACSASSDEPSHVLRAMGLTLQQARSSIRISLGRFTTEKSLNKLLKTLIEIVVKP